MQKKLPSNEVLRKKDGVIDQRQHQIDPAGKQRADPNEAAKRSQKQPGQELSDPQRGTAMSNEPKHAKEKRAAPETRRNSQGDHEGSAHTPDEFNVMNPKKQELESRKTTLAAKNSR